MNRERVVFTMKDGRVAVYQASKRCLSFMSNGGRWNDMPKGFVNDEIERQCQSASGHDPDAVARFCRAMAFGGVTGKEALALLVARDVAYQGSMIELYDVDDIPTDRWFREAWSRSKNGGPINIDLEKAKLIHWEKLKRAAFAENKRREEALYAEPKLVFDNLAYRKYIRSARDHEELRAVWPEGVPCLSPSPSSARSSIASEAAG